MRDSLARAALALVLTMAGATVQGRDESDSRFLTDLTWTSKYMVGGFNIGGDNPALQIAARADLFGTGLAIMPWASVQTERANSQYDEVDIFVLYSKTVWAERRLAVEIHGFYDYWMFPNAKPEQDIFGDIAFSGPRHGNKFQAGVSLPKLLPLSGSFLVPSFNSYYYLYYDQNRADRDQSGSQFEVMLEYFRSIPSFLPHTTYQYAGVAASTNYHDGAFGVRPSWSHTIVSLQSGAYAFASIFILNLHYQWTHEATVNPDNEFWQTVSYVKKF